MVKHKTQRGHYQCDRLGCDARVTVCYLCHREGCEVLSRFNCEDARNCGVGRRASSNSWFFDYTICPVLSRLTQSGPNAAEAAFSGSMA
jgi:hypothetical protein